MNSKDLYLRLLQYLKPYAKGFVAALLSIALFAITEPIVPALMQPLLDGSFVDKTNEQPMWFIPTIIAILFTIRGILFFVSKYLMAWVSQSIVRDLRNELFAKIPNLPSDYFNHNPTGKVISKITYNITQVAETATEVLIILVRDSLTIVGLLIFLVYTSWTLAMFIFIIFPVVAWIIKYISVRLRRLSHFTQDNMGQITHILEETTNGQKIIKMFEGQAYETKRFAKFNNLLRKFFIKSASTNAASISIIQLFNATAASLVIYVALLQAHSGELSVGQFVAFLGGLAMLWPAIKRLTQINEKLQRGLAAADSVFQFSDEMEEIELGEQDLSVSKGEINFKSISFSYPNSNRKVIDDLSLKIAPKEVVALVGESGSGKSSLVQLIARIYNIDTGDIEIDGTNIKDCTLKSLRKNISFVDQNITLFNDTVANNIAYGGLKNASKKDIIQVAKDACAFDFIEKLPNGFSTIIGKDGMTLSGGQRQRIAIARALLKEAPILIMDEATSALDQKLEKQIQKSISSLRNKRTVILITHRLSAITSVDKIYLFKAGKVSEIGTHQSLMQTSKTYQELFHANG